MGSTITDFGSRPVSAVSFLGSGPKPRLLDSVHNRPLDLFDLRAEPTYKERQPTAEAYTDGQLVAAKRIIAAANRKRAGRDSLVRPRSALTAGIVVPRPSGLAWSEQLQAELAATSESMKVAQQKLSEEREMRVSALQAENKAQLEARLARQAAREAAREQRDTERRMLITAGGMRDQREKLEHELVRLNDQQDELHQELEAQRKRALEAELVAENAIEEARVKLERQQAEFDERVRIVEAERAEQARLKRRLETEVEASRREATDKLEAERLKRIEHTKEMAIRRIGKRDLTRGWVAWSDQFKSERKRRQLLKKAGARLTKPKLIASYQLWKHGWAEEQTHKASMSTAEKLYEETKLREKVEEELRKVYQELEEARQAMLDGRGLEAELQRQMEERLAAEKEKRIEHTKEMAIRRIGKRDLTRGWVAWSDLYVEKKRRINVLRAAGAKLMRPHLVMSYNSWRRSWDHAMRKNLTQSAEGRLASQVAELEERLESAYKEIEAARRAGFGGRLTDEEVQRQIEEVKEAERQKRIEHTKEMAIRRIGKRDLTRGWVAWSELYLEQRRRRNALKAAGARLTRPKLVASYMQWRQDWIEEQHSKASLSIAEKLALAEKERDVFREERDKLADELAQARQAMLEGRGMEEELQRQMEERLAAEKEKRIEHTKEMAIRRIGKRDLARGWTAWVTPYLEWKRRERMLKAASSKLTKPKLTFAYTQWRRDWEAETSQRGNMTLEQRLGERILQLTKQLAEAQQQIERGGQGKDELLKTFEEQRAAEREQRIAHTQQMAVKRIGKRDLTRGWVGWYEAWMEHARKRNLLRAAGTRLTKPKMIASYQLWRTSWRAAQEALKMRTLEGRLQAQVTKLSQELEEARQAMLDGRGLEAELQRQMEERLAAEKEKRIEHTKEMAIRRIGKRDLSRGWTAWSEQHLEKKRRAQMLKAAGNRLMRPKLTAGWQHWQRDWAADKHIKSKLSVSAQLNLANKEVSALTLKLQQAENDLAAARQAMMEGRGLEAEQQRLMKERLEAEREKRIEHTKEMAVRRIGKRDLTRGWTAWSEGYLEARRRHNVLLAAGNKLTKPKLTMAYTSWRRDWELETSSKATMSLEERLAVEVKEKKELQEAFAKATRELHEARQAMLEGRGMEAEQQRQMEERLAAEKEKRIEHTKEMAIRRIGKRDLTRGWVAWSDLYLEQRRRNHLLRAAGNKLTKPKLSAAYRMWFMDWQEEAVAKASMTVEQRMGQQLLETQQRLKDALAALELAKQAGFDGMSELEYQKQLEDAKEEERNKRIKQVQDMAVRRIGKRDLTRGWTAWHDQWDEKQRRKRMLKAAGVKLLKPKMVYAYSFWRRGWMEETLASSKMTMGQRLQQALDERNEMQTQLAAVITGLKKELEEARQAMLDGRGMEAELQRQLDEKLRLEKEKRVEHTKEMAVRRVLKRDLSRGWGAWSDMYLQKRRQQSMLKKASARLTKPKLIHSFVSWKKDWEFVQRKEDETRHMSTEERLRQKLMEATTELTQLRKALANGEGAEAEIQRQMEERLEHEREKRVEHTKQMAVRRIAKRDLSRGWVAWLDMYLEKTRRARVLMAASAKLMKPHLVSGYSFWKRDWSVEAASKKNRGLGVQTARALREGEAAKNELAIVLAELEKLRAATVEGRGAEFEAQRKLEEQLTKERQKRVEHIQYVAGKRLGNRQLSLGWVKWHGDYTERVRHTRVLRQAGAKLLRPRLIGSYKQWWTDWQVSQAEAKAGSLAEQVERAKRETKQRDDELRRALEALEEARQAMAEGRGLELVEHQKMEEKLEAERLKRVEHTQHMALHRLQKRELSKGFLGWSLPYLEMKRRKRLLQNAGNRLLRPKFVKSFQRWKTLSARNKAAKSAMSMEQQLSVEKREREALSVKLNRVQREYQDQLQLDSIALVEARAQVKQLQEQLNLLDSEVSSEKKGSTLALTKAGIAQEALEEEKRAKKAAQDLLAEQQKQAADHLAKQLKEVRGTLEIQLKSAREEIRALKQQLADLEAEMMRNKVRQANAPPPEDRGGGKSPAEVQEEKTKRARKGGILGEVDFDEEKPLAPQLREALQKHAVRVLDLFREWDANGDGQISKKEFQKAMPMLGMDLPVKAVNDLFDQYDPDKSGVMEFAELQKMLRRPAGEAAAAPAPPKGGGLARFKAAGAVAGAAGGFKALTKK